MTFPFLGAVTGSKATSMVNDLAALILSKSQIGEEYQVSTEDIQVEIFLAQRSHDFINDLCLSFWPWDIKFILLRKGKVI